MLLFGGLTFTLGLVQLFDVVRGPEGAIAVFSHVVFAFLGFAIAALCAFVPAGAITPRARISQALFHNLARPYRVADFEAESLGRTEALLFVVAHERLIVARIAVEPQQPGAAAPGRGHGHSQASPRRCLRRRDGGRSRAGSHIAPAQRPAGCGRAPCPPPSRRPHRHLSTPGRTRPSWPTAALCASRRGSGGLLFGAPLAGPATLDQPLRGAVEQSQGVWNALLARLRMITRARPRRR